MRTTLSLDDDILQAARDLARVEGRSLGAVVSGLARRGLVPGRDRLGEENGFPVFDRDGSYGAITDEMVRRALDEG